MKGVISSTWNKLQSWVTNYRIAAAFLFGIVVAIRYSLRYISYVKDFGSAVQCFETCIWLGSQPRSLCFLILGGLLLLSDAPFLTPLSLQEMLRIGRIKWVWSQIIYIITASILYFSILFLFVSILSSAMVGTYLLGGWSTPLKALASQRTSAAITNYGITFPFPEMLQKLTPIKAMIACILFNSMYLSVICLPILCVNLLTKENVGWIVGSSIHFLGYMMQANEGYELNWSMKYSLLCCSIPGYQYTPERDMPPLYCFAMLFVCICLSSLLCRWNAKK